MNKSIVVKKIDEFIAGFPKDTQAVLEKLRATIKKIAPKATETISYGIPTFDIDENHLVHFAAFKKHISFFPTSSPIPVFKKELAQYKTSKGTIQFPLGQKIPYDLIKQITAFRVKEIAGLVKKNMQSRTQVSRKRNMPDLLAWAKE